jgi:hypothetical protein
MTDETPKDYDGQIVVVIDREIRADDVPETYVSAEGVEVEDFDFLRILAKRYRNDNPDEYSGFLKKSGEKDYRNQLKALNKKYGDKISRTILEGRIRVSLLLDTIGGDAQIGSKIVGAMKQVASNGGISEAYVPRRSYSAGADIFANASKRYALPDSLLIWHLSNMSSGETVVDVISTEEKMDISPELLAEMRNEFEEDRRRQRDLEIADLDGRLEGIVAPEKRTLLHEKIGKAEADDTNHDRAIAFSGIEFHELGAVTKLFPDAKTMHEHFNASTCIVDQRAAKGFFAISALATHPQHAGRLLGKDYFEIAIECMSRARKLKRV